MIVKHEKIELDNLTLEALGEIITREKTLNLTVRVVV